MIWATMTCASTPTAHSECCQYRVLPIAVVVVVVVAAAALPLPLSPPSPPPGWCCIYAVPPSRPLQCSQLACWHHVDFIMPPSMLSGVFVSFGVGRYCTATVGYNNISVTGLKFGFCVAATCSTENVSDSVNAILNVVRPSIDEFIYLNSATVHCPEPADPFNVAFYVTMALYALLVVLCIAGTWLKWPKPKPEAHTSGKDGGELAEPMLDVVKGDDVRPVPCAFHPPCFCRALRVVPDLAPSDA